MRGKWRIEEEVPPRPWHEEAWVMDSPFPTCWGLGTGLVKRSRSSALSRQLAASDRKIVNQKCFDPLPGVTLTSTEWGEPYYKSEYVWQVDNRSSAAVHFCARRDPSVILGWGYHYEPLHTRVEARRCVDVLRILEAVPILWEVITEEKMQQREQKQQEEQEKGQKGEGGVRRGQGRGAQGGSVSLYTVSWPPSAHQGGAEQSFEW